MKALLILLLIVCAALAVWWWRDDITGMRLRFVERESGGARFSAPTWRVSADDASPSESHLILKHKRRSNRVFSLTGRYADARLTPVEREALLLLSVAAASEMVDAEGKATWSDETLTIAGQKARRATIAFAGQGVGPGVLLVWEDPSARWRWTFVLVDDDAAERERIVREFVSSFALSSRPAARVTGAPKGLVFDAPAGWKRVESTPARTVYLSPGEDAMIELHAPTRTSRSTMTKDFAQSQAAAMVKAAGATWQLRSIELTRDARLNAPVAVVRGTAQQDTGQRPYEIHLWILPNRQSLHIAALSALDEATLDAHTGVFDRIHFDRDKE
ncbi:MAG: hypothetical protein JW889_07675 [Verrucomicrobia bacterium]|nr:hypothetical protein [Verrucomicrobiota bacterium]